MTAPLDEKGLEAAEVAWRASVAPTCKLMLTAAIRAYLAASPSPSEMEVVEGLLNDGQPLVTLSQAQSSLAAMRAERDEQAANATKWFQNFSTTIRRAQAAEARIKALEEALSHALDHYDRNICMHESVHRGGSIWTICDDCGRQWADDKGGFQPHVDPAEISAARTTLQKEQAE